MLVSRQVLPRYVPGKCDSAGAAVGWSIRIDKKGFCEKSADNTGPCHTALIAVALVFAWLSAGVGACSTTSYNGFSLNAQRHDPAYGGGVYADHAEKKKETSTLPIHLPRRTISDPVMIHAGQFSEYVPEDDDTKFTEIPLRQHRMAAA